jgi:hypothetical protein
MLGESRLVGSYTAWEGPSNILTVTAWYGMLKSRSRSSGASCQGIPSGNRGLFAVALSKLGRGGPETYSLNSRSAHAMETPMLEARIENLVAMSTGSPSGSNQRPLLLALAISVE